MLQPHSVRSPASTGYSFKAQALYAVVFATRYLDLVLQFISFYNTLMKLFYILTSFYILYSMRFRFRTTLPADDPDNDTFRVAYLLPPCLLLALIFNYRLTPIDVLWSFSIFLESVAIAPTYRALYIVNWVYRYFVEHRADPIAAVGGIIQTGVWIFYFCVYFI
ncbi:ER lumen protein retaining receptor-domain-containing protein [Mycena pura]|uniref:ER lumen protein retaining receptor-domain-containing protein n=1 Tax=Mycena pura TaxID=153505 RepID=A0AAD6VC85_9AGAR|nr:ER lumen protein retaining receptor-domain-containing protein [Mycena pura]